MKSPRVTGNVDLVIAGEWVDPEHVVEFRDKYCDTKRIETGFQQRQAVGQRRQALVLLISDLDDADR